MKESQEKYGIKKFVKKAFDVVSFTVFVFAKAILGPSDTKDKESEKPKGGLKYDDVAPLFKKAYGSMKKEVKEGISEVKELKQSNKKQYKTWARVKQDFNEWYSALRIEFERKGKRNVENAQAPSVPVETEEQVTKEEP